MAIKAQDLFIRANVASGWGTSTNDGNTWSNVRGTPTWSVSSNEGLFSAGGGTFAINRLGSGTNANQEILVRVQPGDTTNNIGTVARFVDLNNFYYGVLVNGTALIGKNVAGTFTTLTSTSFSYSTSNFYWLRFNLVSNNLKLKAWQDGIEPAAFTISTTDAAIASGGYAVGSDSGSTSKFDHFTVTDTVASHLLIADGMGGVFS